MCVLEIVQFMLDFIDRERMMNMIVLVGHFSSPLLSCFCIFGILDIFFLFILLLVNFFAIVID